MEKPGRLTLIVCWCEMDRLIPLKPREPTKPLTRFVLKLSPSVVAAHVLAAAAKHSNALADGREDWIIVWKKDADGQKLWNQICPTVSVGDPPEDNESRFAYPPNLLGSGLSRSGPLPPIQCTAYFRRLLNGLAGRESDHLTWAI
jgi:hypothetical protein